MDELAQALEELRRMAPVLEALVEKRRATLEYHPLADAVCWSDEIPPDLEPESENAMRFLLRYRTTLLLGHPEEEWRAFWDIGKEVFPRWIGFLPTRVTPSQGITEFYQRSAAAFDDEIDLVFGDEIDSGLESE